jgi:hypothetical protein
MHNHGIIDGNRRPNLLTQTKHCGSKTDYGPNFVSYMSEKSINIIHYSYGLVAGSTTNETKMQENLY